MRRLLGVIASLSFIATATDAQHRIAGIMTDDVVSTRGAVAYANQFSGPDFGAKINAACAALPPGGGTVDARGLYGSQTMTTTISCGPDSKAITILLGAATIAVSKGAQFEYHTNTHIIGAGPSASGYPYGTHFADSDSHAFFVYGGSSQPEGVDIARLSYSNSESGSTGVDYTLAIWSRLDYLFLSADVGYVIGGTGICACYNVVDDVSAFGSSYGGKYLATANMNQAYATEFRGKISLYIGRTAVSNQFYSADFESGSTPIEISGESNTFYSPYFEVSGASILLEPGAASNAFYGAGGIPSVADKSGNSTNYYMLIGGGGGSTGVWPEATAVQSTYYFGNAINGLYNDSVAFSMSSCCASYPVDLRYVGNAETVYGDYGHTPIALGSVTSYGGDTGYGRKTVSALSTPTTPVIAQIGTAGSVDATYYVVCHDRNGGRSLPSGPGSTSSGNASLSATNYNLITWTAEDGCSSWDILKGDTAHSIATDQFPVVTVGKPSFLSFKDRGQSTTAYAAPTRNSTADEIIAGSLQEGCAGTASLVGGSGSVSNPCITGSRPVVCTDNTATTAAAVSCVPSSGSLSIHGNGSDKIAWAQL